MAAAEEGRRVYANIRRFLLYGLSGGTAEIAVMLVGPFLGLALPLLRPRSCGSTCSPAACPEWRWAASRPIRASCADRPVRPPKASWGPGCGSGSPGSAW